MKMNNGVKMRKLTNGEILEILYHNCLVFDPRVTEIGLQDGQVLYIIKGELWIKEDD